MNPETQKDHSREPLSRKQKLLGRFLPAALLAAGGGALAAENLSDSEEATHEAFAASSATSNIRVVEAFGGEDSDWGHGAAERAIKKAVYEAAIRNHARVSVGNEVSAEQVDIAALVDALPTYDEATEALEMAKYSEVTPDDGDLLSVDVSVTTEVTNDKRTPVITYEVTDASIEDVHNNQ